MTRSRLFLLAALIAATRLMVAEMPDVRVIQGFSLMCWAKETIDDEDSPVYPIVAGEPDYSSNSLADYTLRFITNSATGTVVAEGTMNSKGEYDGKVLQAWCGASLFDGWALNFGKKIVKWEDGGFTNPSDLVNARIAYGQRGEREGRQLAEIVGVLPVGDAFSLDLSAVAPLDPATERAADIPVYLSCGTMLYPFEIRVKGGFRKGSTPDIGLALKASLLNLQWYVDALYSRESGVTAIDRDKTDIFRGCLGLTGTLPLRKPYADGVDFAFEVSGRSDGLTRDEGVSYVTDVGRIAANPSFRVYDEYRWYAFGKATMKNVGNANLDWSESWYFNMVDPSGSLESKLSWSPRKVLTVDFAYTFRHGDSSSEVATFGSRHQFELALSKSF